MSITGKRRSAGFTLLEMMMVLVVLGILVALGAPSMAEILRRNALDSMLADLRSSLSFARSEAINRSRLVTVCQSDDGERCTSDDSGNWSNGWIVFVDPSNAGVVDDGEEILRSHGALAAGTTASLNNVIQRDFVQFDRNGFIGDDGAAQGLFVLCQAGGEARHARGLLINISGRVLATRDSNNDGIHNSSQETNLTCP